MKCLVCGKDYEAAECPRCHFPNIQIVGDREKALENLLPTINQYRMNFAGTVAISLVTYRWKDQNGRIALKRKEQMPLGTATELLQGEKWLDEKFARIPDQKEITVTLCISMGGEERTVSVSVPNLQRAELQQLGIRMDSDYRLYLLLRNDTDRPTTSEPVELFAGE